MVATQIFGGHRMDVETGGFVTFDVQLTNSPHKHDYFEICLALSGQGKFIHGGVSYDLEPGSIFLAEPGVVHEITSFDTKDLHLYFISMTVTALGSKVESPEGAILARFLDSRNIVSSGHQSLARYVPLFEEHDGFGARGALGLFALEMVNGLCKLPSQVWPHQEEGEMVRAVTYIEDRLRGRITVDEVAAAVGLSPRTLRRRFRDEFGTTVVDEINHRRMRWAAHRLLMGFGVTEVADHVGIANPAQFTRAFQRSFGVAPKKFQSSYMPGTYSRRTRPPD